MKTFCDDCRSDVEYEIRNIIEKKEIRDLKIEYTAQSAYCSKCGNEIFIHEINDKNLKKINKAYRERRNKKIQGGKII